ncbi:MAG: hypothetical protein NTX61_01680 [Bacteroidetes bacterium]|nr:hypothetical protein [Bacteroidota bacterium]
MNKEISEILTGHFCSKCGRSASQIEVEEHMSYSTHLLKVEGNDVKKTYTSYEAQAQTKNNFQPKLANLDNLITQKQNECGSIETAMDASSKEKVKYIDDYHQQKAEYINNQTNQAINAFENSANNKDQKIEDVNNSGNYKTIDNGAGVIANTRLASKNENEKRIYGDLNTDKYNSNDYESDLLSLPNQMKDYISQVRENIQNGTANLKLSTIQVFKDGSDYINLNTGIDVGAKGVEFIKDKISDAITNLPEMQTINDNILKPVRSSATFGVVSLYVKMRELPAQADELMGEIIPHAISYLAGEKNDVQQKTEGWLNNMDQHYSYGK